MKKKTKIILITFILLVLAVVLSFIIEKKEPTNNPAGYFQLINVYEYVPSNIDIGPVVLQISDKKSLVKLENIINNAKQSTNMTDYENSLNIKADYILSLMDKRKVEFYKINLWFDDAKELSYYSIRGASSMTGLNLFEILREDTKELIKILAEILNP